MSCAAVVLLPVVLPPCCPVTVGPRWHPCAHMSVSPPLPPHQTQASAADYLSGVAFRTGVELETLLADNLDTVKNLDAPLKGTRLVVCGSQAAAAGEPRTGAP